MIVLNELAHCASKMSLAKRNELFQALRLDRQDESLRVRVQVGTPRRQLDAFDSGSAKEGAELVGEQRVPIVNQKQTRRNTAPARST
jgi:hypothetical protein